MSAAVGADIESLCSKCGDVWHVVVAKVGENIVKVQCKQCGGYHRHKPIGGKPAPRARTSSVARPKAAREAVARIDTPSVAADLSKPPRTYNASERYAIGDRIEHPTFGSGVVEALPEPGKMTVFFATGRRLLVHAKEGGGGLQRPQRIVHQAPGTGHAGHVLHAPHPGHNPTPSDEDGDEVVE
jgi:hypothetical protein